MTTNVDRWDAEAIEYTDIVKLRAALVGRSIVETIGSGGGYPATVKFVLDDGSVLNAHATDGGCGCSNGCFSVRPQNVTSGTITNVELREEAESWDTSGMTEVAPGSISDGEAKISIFVYTDLGKQLLLTSEGGDNGYYGWGFWLHVDRPDGSN